MKVSIIQMNCGGARAANLAQARNLADKIVQKAVTETGLTLAVPGFSHGVDPTPVAGPTRRWRV